MSFFGGCYPGVISWERLGTNTQTPHTYRGLHMKTPSSVPARFDATHTHSHALCLASLLHCCKHINIHPLDKHAHTHPLQTKTSVFLSGRRDFSPSHLPPDTTIARSPQPSSPRCQTVEGDLPSSLLSETPAGSRSLKSTV